MRLGHRAAHGLVVATVLAGTGCQTFVGIDDAAQHLPRLDGNYLVAIDRARAAPNSTVRDTIRMQGSATLDVDARTLDLSLNILPFGGGSPISETTINDIVFPDDSDEVAFVLDLTIPAGAINPTPTPSMTDLRINVPVIVIAEADYAFCAKPEQPASLPTLGSILVDGFTTLPATPDVDCDDELRQ